MVVVAVRWIFSCVATAAAVALLAGCAVGPDFRAPAPPETNRYTKEPRASHTSGADVPTGAVQRFEAGRDVPKDWWTLFKSPALNALIERAMRNNPNVQSALASLRAAKQAVYAQEGHYFPLVQANFNPSRQQLANNPLGATSTPVVGTAPSGAAIVENPFSVITAQLTVAYTLDVWGLNRRTVEALQATADNQRFEAEAAYLSLASNVAVAAITEASLRAQIDATNNLIKINRSMVDTLRQQFEKGAVTRGDLALQEAALAQEEATLPPLRKALAQNRDLLAALVGGFPSDEPHEIFKLADLHLPTNLPVSLPSQLIEQRPDVRAAEELLHAAGAQIGVATANILPSFTINGNAGYTNLTLANLLAPQNAFWLIAGNATQTIFDGGTLFHLRDQAKDNYQAAAWTYRGAVVTAVQNVSDSLRAIENDADELKAAHAFERAANISFEQARRQFQEGSVNVLILLTAQQAYLQAVIQVVQARAARLSDTAALFQALGGGWWNRAEPFQALIVNVSTGETKTIAEPPQTH
jgi:NodT family efflux transporter outer membrane factor (OMF) lipoprotein